jgi:hypothetical protein
MFKKQVSLMLISLKDDPLLANITYKQWLRQACISRNTMVTLGDVTPIELAFGRRPADITAIELMNPAQLTTEALAPERQIEALRSPAMRKFLEAKQSDALQVNSNLVMDHTFLVIKFTIGPKTNQKSNQTVHMEENG